ncbi:phosphoadenosine phosphosulfate reductase [Diaporthe helianthi]|uniref:FAD synthase n=1 Tax=Diaporthe helianthi TaxID=158607 RepID=A0A2P5HUK9_DIAHE|nr:phosphoadenosine phosphosulfate reductase [Diaporthe helianthi]
MPHHHLANGVSPTANGSGVQEPPAAGPAPSLSLRHVCLQLQAKVDAFLAQEADTSLLKGVQAHVREAMSVVDEALERYSIEELSLSYNGGKDCLVLLVLILACLPRHFEPPDDDDDDDDDKGPPPPSSSSYTYTYTTNRTAPNGLTSQIPTNTPAAPTPVRSRSPRPFPTSLQSVYIVAPDPFAEVDAFVEHSAATYHLDLSRYALPMRAALDAYLRDRPRLRAVFVGTRRTDPHGAALTHFDPTDGDWPAFVRVHPVIDWHYAEIWAFLRHLGIPYISLYDQGYTSLGGTKDTHPNPLLKRQPDAAADPDTFRPAYELVDDDEERLGRDR